MTTVLITGGTGMIGKALTRALLEKNYKVIILSRQTRNKLPHPTGSSSQGVTGYCAYAQWNIRQQSIDNDAIANADYIIHLAGAGISEKRWTKKRKDEIVNSRVNSSKLLVKAIQEIPNNIKAVITASALGWYGPDPVIPNPNPFKEESPANADFLGKACKQWEESIAPVTKLGKRLVKLRTGIVLSKAGGALPEFKKPLRFGIAAILGSGKQIMSWIHIDDLVRLYIASIENENMSGAYNAVAPNPVSNKYFTVQLARIKRGKFFIPLHIPSLVLRLVLGEISDKILKSATLSTDKVLDTGFVFQFSFVEVALKSLK